MRVARIAANTVILISVGRVNSPLIDVHGLSIDRPSISTTNLRTSQCTQYESRPSQSVPSTLDTLALLEFEAQRVGSH